MRVFLGGCRGRIWNVYHKVLRDIRGPERAVVRQVVLSMSLRSFGYFNGFTAFNDNGRDVSGLLHAAETALLSA